MNRLPNRKPFDLGKTFVCTRDLTPGGKLIRAGEVFPWKELGVSAERVYDLWNAFYLQVTEPAKLKTAKG